MYAHLHYTGGRVMQFRWSPSKNEELKLTRGISFEEIIQAEMIVITEHPSRSNQDMLLFKIEDYIWIVPCVANEGEIFLKTAFPSRKYTKKWRAGEFT